jgi:HSP20 family molecular chaperone IbpA
MSIFQDFNTLQNQMNRMMSDFGRHSSSGWGQGFGQSPFGGGGFWDEDVLDLPLLTSGRPLGDISQQSRRGGKGQEEMKLEEGVGQPSVGGTQLSTQNQPGPGTMMQTFMPQQALRARVNIEEQKDKFIVTSDMPGFDKSNIKVNLADDGLLHIRGEQTKEFIDEAKDKKYLRAERTFSNVQRNLRLPRGVDASKITANYENGVLHVVLPKTEEAQKAKQEIEIK